MRCWRCSGIGERGIVSPGRKAYVMDVDGTDIGLIGGESGGISFHGMG
jgi:hypothetical protein